jgi:ABC-type nitrate/sulfonate/bicarbonate transport system substrate-binding protein
MLPNNFKPIKKVILLALMLVVILPMVMGSASCTSQPETITIGVPAAQSWILDFIKGQKYFTDNGLDVNIKVYNTPAGMVEGISNGGIDMMIASENFFLRQVFQNFNASIITTIAKIEQLSLMGRKASDVESITDLKGKTIGLFQNSIEEFYLGRFLSLRGLSIQDVTLVNQTYEQRVDAMVKGSVDAVVMTEPYFTQIQQQLTDGTVYWPIQNSQSAFMVAACSNSWINRHPQTIRKELKAFVQAEEYAVNHPDDAKRQVQKLLNYTDAAMATFWSQNQFSVTLDLSLIVAMNDEAHWMIDNNLTTEKVVPDFMNYVYTDGLKAIKPGTVNISK